MKISFASLLSAALLLASFVNTTTTHAEPIGLTFGQLDGVHMGAGPIDTTTAAALAAQDGIDLSVDPMLRAANHGQLTLVQQAPGLPPASTLPALPAPPTVTVNTLPPPPPPLPSAPPSVG